MDLFSTLLESTNVCMLYRGDHTLAGLGLEASLDTLDSGRLDHRAPGGDAPVWTFVVNGGVK